MKNQKGFTLIELLVVIAIIGILSGIAFVSISGARESAYDTKIQSEISQIRTNAEQFYYDNGGEYTGYDSSEGWNKLKGELPPCSAAYHSDAGFATPGEYQIDVASQEYAAWAALCGDSTASETQWYCVDSEGSAGKYTGFNSPGTKCGTVFTTEVN